MAEFVVTKGQVEDQRHPERRKRTTAEEGKYIPWTAQTRRHGRIDERGQPRRTFFIKQAPRSTSWAISPSRRSTCGNWRILVQGDKLVMPKPVKTIIGRKRKKSHQPKTYDKKIPSSSSSAKAAIRSSIPWQIANPSLATTYSGL